MAEATEGSEDSVGTSSSENSEVDKHKENEQLGDERLCDPFLDRFAGMVNHKNVSAILADQAHMLGVLEISNEKLASLNNISQLNYQTMSAEFRQSTQTLMVMKRELDSIFRRIRSLKTTLSTQYPAEYAAAERQRMEQLHVDDEDEET